MADMLVSSRRVVRPAIIVVVGLVFGASAVALGLAPRQGCDPLPVGSIVESTAFTPAQIQRGGQLPLTIDPATGPVMLPSVPGVLPDSIRGRAVVSTFTSAGATVVYYLDRPIDAPMSGVDFYKAGGLRFGSQPRTGDGDLVDDIVATVGDRAIVVEIGPHRAALVWADPTRVVDLRTHNLYWTDGSREYFLVADMGPEAIVNIARELVCGS